MLQKLFLIPRKIDPGIEQSCYFKEDVENPVPESILSEIIRTEIEVKIN